MPLIKKPRARQGTYLPSEPQSEPVIHVLSDKETLIGLDTYKYPAPVFQVTRLYPDQKIWEVKVIYGHGFTEDMLKRVDVVEYMLTTESFIDRYNISTIRESVSRLLIHWSKIFPRGVPNRII